LNNKPLYTQIDQNSFNQFYHRQLFEKFFSAVNNSPYKLKPSCPFNFVYSFFSYLKIDKKTAREIIKFWVSTKWCQRAKYYGIKVRV